MSYQGSPDTVPVSFQLSHCFSCYLPSTPSSPTGIRFSRCNILVHTWNNVALPLIPAVTAPPMAYPVASTLDLLVGFPKSEPRTLCLPPCSPVAHNFAHIHPSRTLTGASCPDSPSVLYLPPYIGYNVAWPSFHAHPQFSFPSRPILVHRSYDNQSASSSYSCSIPYFDDNILGSSSIPSFILSSCFGL